MLIQYQRFNPMVGAHPTTKPTQSTAPRFGTDEPTAPQARLVPMSILIDTTPVFDVYKRTAAELKTKASKLTIALWIAENMLENGWGKGYRLPNEIEIYKYIPDFLGELTSSSHKHNVVSSNTYLTHVGLTDDKGVVLRDPTHEDVRQLREMLNRLDPQRVVPEAAGGPPEMVRLEGLIVKPETLAAMSRRAREAGSSMGALLDETFKTS
jgi:hypothetical protein